MSALTGAREDSETRGRPGIKKGGTELKKPPTPRKPKAMKRTSPAKEKRGSMLKGMCPAETKELSKDQKELIEKAFDKTLPAGLRWRKRHWGPNTRSLEDVKFCRLRTKGEAYKAKRKGQNRIWRRENARLAFPLHQTAGERYLLKTFGSNTKPMCDVSFPRFPTAGESYNKRVKAKEEKQRKTMKSVKFAVLPCKAEAYRRKLYGPKTTTLASAGSFARLPTKGEVYARSLMKRAKAWVAMEERPVNVMATIRFKLLPTAGERYLRRKFGPGVKSVRENMFERAPTKGEVYCKKIGLTGNRIVVKGARGAGKARKRLLDRQFPLTPDKGFWRKNKFVPYAG